MMDHRPQRSLRPSGSGRRAAARGRLAAWLFRATALATAASGTPTGFADPHPLVPPLACCENYHTPCASAHAACVPLPYPLEGGGALGAPRRWDLTVQEAVQVAIGNSEAVRNLGLVEAASRNDIVRSVITAYDPLEARSEAAAQWGIFDPLWTTSMQWDRMDIPPGTSFSGIGNRPPRLDTADFETSLEQLLPLGTRVRVDSVVNYLFNPDKPPGLVPNPQYFSYTQFGFSHPLLQGSGVDVTMAPIKIASARAEQTDWQFKQEMLALVRSVETTYWSLYAQQQNLAAIDQVLPLFRETVRLRSEQATANLGTPSDVSRVRSDLLLYEQRRLDTMARIAEQQLVLRNLMGLPADENVDIWTLAVPQTTMPAQTMQAAIMEAVNRRPDVLRQRLAVFIAQQERLLADNALQPRLDVTGFWRLNGLGEELDDSVDVQTENDYRDWQLGVFFQIPLGRRQGFATRRAAEYRLSRERAMLQQTVHQASFEVADAYRRINWLQQQRALMDERVTALSQWRAGAQAQFENPPPGVSPAFALELYLQNLRDGLESSLSGSSLLADYNSALARLEEVKGTLLDRRLVQVAGDPSGEILDNLPPAEMQLPESVLPLPQAVETGEPTDQGALQTPLSQPQSVQAGPAPMESNAATTAPETTTPGTTLPTTESAPAAPAPPATPQAPVAPTTPSTAAPSVGDGAYVEPMAEPILLPLPTPLPTPLPLSEPLQMPLALQPLPQPQRVAQPMPVAPPQPQPQVQPQQMALRMPVAPTLAAAQPQQAPQPLPALETVRIAETKLSFPSRVAAVSLPGAGADDYGDYLEPLPIPTLPTARMEETRLSLPAGVGAVGVPPGRASTLSTVLLYPEGVSAPVTQR